MSTQRYHYVGWIILVIIVYICTSLLDSCWMNTFMVIEFVHLYGVWCCNVGFIDERLTFLQQKKKKKPYKNESGFSLNNSFRETSIPRETSSLWDMIASATISAPLRFSIASRNRTSLPISSLSHRYSSLVSAIWVCAPQ